MLKVIRCRERRKRLQEHLGYAQPCIVGKSSQPISRGGAGSQPNSRGGAGSQPNSRGGAIILGSQPNSRGGAIIIDRILLVSAAGSRLRELAEVVVVAGSTPSSSIQPCQFLGNELVSHSSELYG